MKQAPINLGAITHALGAFFSRFHIVTFTVVVLGGLSLTTLLFFNAMMSAEDISNQESIEASMPDFDQATIDRLNNLQQSTDVTDLQLPANQRLNPFTE